MYESFYGLKKKPFRIVPDPGCLYLSPKHEKALTYLEYGLMENVGFVVLTGEVGTGKTTLIRYMLGRMEKEILTAVVYNTNSSAREIVELTLQSFDLPSDGGKAKSLQTLHRFLIERITEGKRNLLIIDEAQNLSGEAMEEVRMLSNLQNGEEHLLQIMLSGQPELRARLRQHEFSSFSQRIGVQYHLSPLSRDEAKEYIAYRLEQAGAKEEIFEPEAFDLIFQASAGVPRTINQLCDAALVYGFGYELRTIGIEVIVQVIQDRDGIGLANGATRADEEISPGPAEGTPGQEFRGRLDAVEAEIAKLRMEMDRQAGEFEKKDGNSRKEGIARLRELYFVERKRSDKLLIQYAVLRDRYRQLEKALKNNK